MGRDAVHVWSARKSFLGAVAWFGGGFSTPRSLSVAGSDVVPVVTDHLAASLAPLVAGRAGSGTASRVILDPLTGAIRDRGPGATAFPWRRHAAELQWHVGLPGTATASAVDAAAAWVGRAHDAVAGASAGA